MIDSSSHLRLRILTGLHSGAELPLSQGSYAIGSDPECEIMISDWPFKRSEFSIIDSGWGMFSVVFVDPEVAAPFGISQPRLVGDVAIAVCDGSGETPRPTDLELLSILLAPVAPPMVKAPRVNKWLVAVTAGTFVVVGAIVLQSPKSVAAPTPQKVQVSAVGQVREILSKLNYQGIHTSADGDVVTVEGLLNNQDEQQRLTDQLSMLKDAKIRNRYAVATDIEAAITDAIAKKGVSVKYLGEGQFEVRGALSEAAKAKIDLNRLKADLGQIVTSIKFKEANAVVIADKDSENSQNNQGYQFKLASDGVKYFMQK
jgi:type III secretion protein D